MNKLVIAVFAILGVVPLISGTPIALKRSDFVSMPLEEGANANEWVDEFLRNLQPFLITHHLDPFPLMDLSLKFGFSIFSVHIDLTRGYLQDISTLRRQDGTNSTLKYEAKIITVDFDLQFSDVIANYEYEATFWNLGPWGKLNARATDQLMTTSIQYDSYLDMIYLLDFKLKNVGNVDIDITGLTIIGDALVGGFMEGLTGLFKGTVFGIITNQIKDYINNAFDAYNRHGSF